MSAAVEVYPANRIKRHRATKADVEQRRNDLLNIVAAMKPATVRQVFYRLVVQKVIEKTETSRRSSGY